VLRGMLYLKVEVVMKKEYKILIDYKEDSEEPKRLTQEEIDKMDRVWLDTGDGIIELPKELLPYLENADVLGIT
jgi:hypothetical protein